MLNSEGIAAYWEEQTKKGDNPCHYHNKWQDKYAFEVRTRAFKKSDFEDSTNIVDVGCGIGDYTNEIAKLSSAHIDAFDFPFNIEIARKSYPNHPKISFHPYPVPHETMRTAIRNADRVFTTTVYVHFSSEARTAFYSYISDMKSGSRVMLLEYIPEVVPIFQKGLPHKEVETVSEIITKFNQVGFVLCEKRHVNYIDSFLFFHIGKNSVVHWATRFMEQFLRVMGYTKSKYKLLIFEKQ